MPDMSDNFDVDQILDDSDSQSDHLHGVVQSKMQTPFGDWDYSDREHISKLASHPNVNTDHLSKLYSHMMPQDQAQDGTESLGYRGDTAFDSIFSSSKASSADAEDFIKRVWKDSTSRDNDAHITASKVGGVSVDLLKDITDKALNDPEMNSVPKYALPSSFLHNVLASRPMPEPQAGNLNAGQIASNKHVKKIDSLFLGGIIRAEHSPEELDKTVGILTGVDQPYGMVKDDVLSAASNLISRNKNLTSTQIEQLFEHHKDADGGYYNDGIARSVFSHDNVSPDLASKVALSATSYDAKHRVEAISSPVLPQETVDRLISDFDPESPDMLSGSSYYGTSTLQALVGNPNVSEQTLTKIYEKGRQADQKAVIQTSKAPASLIEDYWSKRDKKSDSTKYMINSVQNVPPSVLSDIVGKNKNQALSIEALQHKNADISVVEAGLKRRAAKVQEAAAKHPLVAEKQMTERLADGRMSASSFLFDSSVRKTAGDITSGHVEVIDAQYKDKEFSDYKSDDFRVKRWLATDALVDSDTRNRNKSEIVSLFRDHVGDGNRINDYSSHGSLASSVRTMATEGDVDSQEAVLAKPGILSSIDLSADGLTGDFLGKALDKFRDMHENSAEDRYGDKVFGAIQLENKQTAILTNPNLSQEAFDSVTDSDYFSDDSSARSSSYTSWGVDRDSISTIFDSRHKDSSDDEKQEDFRRVLDMNNPMADYAVALSNSAPKDEWNKAFSRLDAEKKLNIMQNGKEFFRYEDLSDSAHSDLIWGRSNFGANQKLQEASINAMDYSNPAHTAALSNMIDYVHSQEDPIFTDGFMPAKQLAEAITERSDFDSIVGTDQYDDLMRTSLRVSDQLGVNLAIKRAWGEDKDAEFSDKVGKLKGIIESSSGGDQESTNLKWHTAVEQGLGKSDKSGSLDFLYNLPGDAENDYLVRSAGLSKGIFSYDVKIGAAFESADSYGDVLAGLTQGEEANSFIHKTLESEKLTPEIAKKAVNAMLSTTFIPPNEYNKYGNSKMSDSSLEAGMVNIRKSVDDLSASGNHNLIPRMAMSVDNASYSFKITKANQKKMVKAVVSQINETPHLTDSERNSVKYKLHSTFETYNNADMLPASVMGDVAKNVVKDGDVDTMVDMINEMTSPPAAVTKAIAGYMAKPDVLTTDQVLQFSSLAKNDTTSYSQTKAITDAMATRAEANPEDAAELHSKIIQVAGDLSKSNKETKRLHGVGLVNDYLNSDDEDLKGRATHQALRVLKSLEIPMGDKVATFLNMPTSLSADHEHTLDKLAGSQFEKALVNNEEVLLDSTHGWKLDAIISNAIMFTPNTAEVISDRVLSDDKFDMMHRSELAEKLMDNGSIPGETQMKVFNSLDPANKFHNISNTSSDYNFTITGHWRGLSDSVDYVDSQWESAMESADTEAESYGQVLSNLTKLNGVLERSRAFTEDRGTVEAAEAVDSYIEKASGIATKMHSRMMSRIENSPEEIGSDEFGSYIGGLRNFQHSFISSRELGSSSMETLSITNATKDAMEAYASKHGEEKALKDSGFRDMEMVTDAYADHLSRWTGLSEINDRQWSDAMSRSPEIAFLLDNRSHIPMEAIDAVDIEAIAAQGSEATTNLLVSAQRWSEKIKVEDHASMVDFSEKLMPHLDFANESADICIFYQNMAETVGDKMSFDQLDQVMEQLGDKTSYSLLKSAASSGAGGEMALNKAVSQSIEDNMLGFPDYGRTAKFTPDHISQLMPSILSLTDRYQKTKLLQILADNQSLDSNSLRSMYSSLDSQDSFNTSQVVSNIMEHANVDFDLFHQIYSDTQDKYGDGIFRTGESFNPAFKNRRFGGKLFRDQPVSIPKEQPDTVNRDPSSLIYSVEHSKDKQALRDAVQILPSEGINYGKFKKINKKLAENKAVKEVFMNAKKQVAMPEDLSRAIEKAGGDFHITYSTWDGAQRHSSASNLVMQLNTGEHMEAQLKEDPKLWSFFQMVQAAANQTNDGGVGSHPTTPHCAGWTRLDTTGGKEGWVIEELQSDFAGGLRQEIKNIKSSHPEGLKLDGEFYHPDEMDVHSKKIEKIVQGWHEAAMKGLQELARRQGVKTLFLHGEGVRSVMSFGDYGDSDRPNPVWMQHMYSKWPKKNGWDECDYTDYPSYDRSTKTGAETKPAKTQCWKIDLS
ncbi:MAG: hypothetical protein DRN30_01375 [Thermoplasmata archaeon]|nr:MAG: hypothetical protein DRN30_01375 [Thermoplasmata archaeon]